MSGSVRARGNVWMVDYRAPSGKRYRESYSTKQAAQARLDALRNAAAMGEAMQGDIPHTIQDAYVQQAERWDKQRAGRSQKQNGRSAVDYFGPGRPLVEITSPMVAAYRDHLSKAGLTNATVNRKLSALSVMLKLAAEKGAIATLPYAKRLPDGQHRIRYLDEREAKRLVAYLGHIDDEAGDLAEFLIGTGMRVRQEALRLRVRDIERVKGRLHLNIRDGKGAKPRTVPATRRVQEIVEARMELARAEGRPSLWRTEYTPFYRKVVKAREDLELGEEVNVHTLRHTCASWMVQRGVPLADVQHWMGHTNIQTTLRYAHLATGHLDRALEAME